MSLVNLTNYRDHPTNGSYVVFFFQRDEVADSFEEMLLINAVDFQRDREEEGQRRHLFGVRKTEFKKAEALNYQAMGRHRSPFIPNKIFRYFVLFFTLIILALAVLGALRSGV